MAKKQPKDSQFSLQPDEALVLFELLARFEETGKLEVVDSSEALVLSMLHGKLQRQLVEPLSADYQEILAAARARLRDHVE